MAARFIAARCDHGPAVIRTLALAALALAGPMVTALPAAAARPDVRDARRRQERRGNTRREGRSGRCTLQLGHLPAERPFGGEGPNDDGLHEAACELDPGTLGTEWAHSLAELVDG